MKPDFEAIQKMLSAELDALAQAWGKLPLSVKRILMAYAGISMETDIRWASMGSVQRNQLARAIEKAAGEIASLDAFIADYKEKSKQLAIASNRAHPPSQPHTIAA